MAVPTFHSYASPLPLLAFSSSFFNYLSISQAAERSYPPTAPIGSVSSANFYPKFPFPLQQLSLYLAKSFCEPLILNPKGRPPERRITGATEGPAQGGGARAHPKATRKCGLWQDWPYEKVLLNPKKPLESD